MCWHVAGNHWDEVLLQKSMCLHALFTVSMTSNRPFNDTVYKCLLLIRFLSCSTDIEVNADFFNLGERENTTSKLIRKNLRIIEDMTLLSTEYC